jgi:hypothetical protein
MAFETKTNIRNRDLESQGTWMDYGDDVRFLVARKSNPKYKSFISRKYRENERIISSTANVERADQVSERLMLEATATYLLLDWEGVVEGGKPIKYSPSKAIQVLDDHDDLRADIEAYADNRENYLAEKDEKDAENLKK